MPITPKFTLEQEDDALILRILVPHIRVTNAEIIVDHHDFSFFCKPYLLKLSFPRALDDDEERYTAKYDPNDQNGTLTVKLWKKTPGEYFPELDLLTKLMQIRKVTQMENHLDAEGGIEVMHSENFVDEDDEESPASTSTGEVAGLQLGREHGYGFHDQYTNVLKNLREEIADMLEVEEPERFTASQRRALRIKQEQNLFDPTRYLGDNLMSVDEDMIYQEAMTFQPFWNQHYQQYRDVEDEAKKALPKAAGGDKPVLSKEDKAKLHQDAFQLCGGFTSEEDDILMKQLKHKEFLIEAGSVEETNLLLGMADILFAFCYDFRVTGGDANVESAHNITRLSSVLSWLDKYSSPSDEVSTVIKFNMRRLIIYPYLRVWKLGRKVLTDVVKILLSGKRTVLKCFLQLYHVYEHTDTHYLLNKIFIGDYCTWLQQLDEETVMRFGSEYNKAKNAFEKDEGSGKCFTGFPLEALEALAANEDNELDESMISATMEEFNKTMAVSDQKLSHLNVNDVVEDMLRSIETVPTDIASTAIASNILSEPSAAAVEKPQPAPKSLIQEVGKSPVETSAAQVPPAEKTPMVKESQPPAKAADPAALLVGSNSASASNRPKVRKPLIEVIASTTFEGATANKQDDESLDSCLSQLSVDDAKPSEES